MSTFWTTLPLNLVYFYTHFQTIFINFHFSDLLNILIAKIQLQKYAIFKKI